MELSQEQLNNLHQQWFERYQSVINLSEGNNDLFGYSDVSFNSTKDEIEAAGLEWEVQQALNSYHLDALDVYRAQVKIGFSKNNEPCYEFYSSSGTLLLNSDSIENIVNSFSFNHEVQKKVNPIEYTEQSDEEAKKQVSYLSTIVNKAMEEKNLEFPKNDTKKSIEEGNTLIIEAWTPEKGKQFLASLQTIFEARGEAFHLSSESLDGITKWNDDSESYYPLVDLKETGEPYLTPPAYQIKYPIDSKNFEKLFELEKHSFETERELRNDVTGEMTKIVHPEEINQFRNEDEALDALYPDKMDKDGELVPQEIRIDAYFLQQEVKDKLFKDSKTLEDFKDKIEQALSEKAEDREAADRAYDEALELYEKRQEEWREVQEYHEISEIEAKILNEQEKEKEMNNQFDLETIYDSQKENSNQMTNQNDYEKELLYTYGGLGEPNYLGTVGEVLHDPELRESIDEIGIDMLTEYVTNNVRNGGGTGKQDMPSDLFINPTKVDFQKANVKNYEINQNQNLKEFTREHQVLTIGAELFTEQLEANSNTKGQYFVKINTDTSNHYLSILNKRDENKKEYGKVDFDWSRNSFTMDVMDDKFIKQETVQKFSNIIIQVNPAIEARVKSQRSKINLPKLGR